MPFPWNVLFAPYPSEVARCWQRIGVLAMTVLALLVLSSLALDRAACAADNVDHAVPFLDDGLDTAPAGARPAIPATVPRARSAGRGRCVDQMGRSVSDCTAQGI